MRQPILHGYMAPEQLDGRLEPDRHRLTTGVQYQLRCSSTEHRGDENKRTIELVCIQLFAGRSLLDITSRLFLEHSGYLDSDLWVQQSYEAVSLRTGGGLASRADRVRDLRLARFIALGGLLAVASSCQQGIGVGSALLQPSGQAYFNIGPVPPGEQFVLLEGFLRNTSTTTITIERVNVSGPSGVGSVVKVLDVLLAPLPRSSDGFDFTPAGVFKTLPPAMKLPGRTRCNVQKLVPVRGYELAPGSQTRVLVLLEAQSEGAFNIRDHIVEYRQGGRAYKQSLAIGLKGNVESSAKPMKIYPSGGCVNEVKVLPSG